MPPDNRLDRVSAPPSEAKQQSVIYLTARLLIALAAASAVIVYVLIANDLINWFVAKLMGIAAIAVFLYCSPGIWRFLHQLLVVRAAERAFRQGQYSEAERRLGALVHWSEKLGPKRLQYLAGALAQMAELYRRLGRLA